MEWTVVTVLIAVVGLGISIGAPLIKLNSTITTLTVTLENLKEDVATNAKAIETSRQNAKESHRRLWDHNEKQDEKIENHDRRINTLEREDKNHANQLAR